MSGYICIVSYLRLSYFSAEINLSEDEDEDVDR